MYRSAMGQNNNCLPYKTGSYNVEEQNLLAGQANVTRSRRAQVKPRSRRIMSVPAPLNEENVVVVSKTSRRISDPDPQQKNRRCSSDRDSPTCPQAYRSFRRESLQTEAERSKKDFKTLASRRQSLPFESKRSFRILRGIRSFYGRGHHAQEPSPQSSPSYTPRRRSASLGQVIVAMAHHRLRNSESAGSSPGSRRAAERNKDEAKSDSPPKPSAQDYEGDMNQQPASVESLVRRCASCFDEEGECNGSEFPRVLFLTHVWFMTSEQLVVLFSQLYEDESSPPDLKKKAFFAIRFWMKEFAHMFDLDASLVKAISGLQELAANDDQVDSSIIDISNRGNYRWMRPEHLSVRPPQAAGRKRRKVSLVFHHLQPEELAIHMSYLEFKCFRRLTFEDFHKYAVHGTIKDNAKLERSVFLFNNITYWVQCMVLGQYTPQERASVITKYIKIAQKLREMRNYNTLMAIVGGLTHTAIARMKKTMSALTKETVKSLEELVDLLDSRSNYVAYRRDYAQGEGTFKIPIIGIFMKDIIGLHAALPDRVGDGLINVKKMLTISSTFQELMTLQRTSFPHDVNKDLLNTLRVSLYLYYTEEEIYALSLQREPRDTKYSTSSSGSPAKVNSMLFAEFTKFTCQLDSETVKQHVTAMVESVFKAYDHDNDGFISEEEFNSFTDNFPKMESFAAMDVDRDGRISRAEMCEYFMKASAVRRIDFCQSFTHEFIETSYFHPTFCEQCEKLLWGLVKQGWKCKGCGINCHKHCKDRIVQECRPKQPVSQETKQMNGGSGKRNGKSSVSSESDISANGDAVTSSAGANTSALEDEAFDSPGELSSNPNISQGSPLMRRSTSLASADAPSRNLLRQAQENRTPPPVRKIATPEGGRRSFQRKMQKIIPKRHNSGKSRAIADASTQTPLVSPRTPVLDSFRTPPMKSFLYPAAPDTPQASRSNRSVRNGKLPNGRLGSAGEDIDPACDSPVQPLQHSNNNHIILRVPSPHGNQLYADELSKNMNNLNVKDPPKKGHSPVEPLTICTAVDDNGTSPLVRGSLLRTASHFSVTRRDSGLSGCSNYTIVSSGRSSPATPILLAESNAVSQPTSGRTPNLFKFPNKFLFEDLDKTSTDADIREENVRLRDTNVILQAQLNAANDYAKTLEQKLKELGVAAPEALQEKKEKL